MKRDIYELDLITPDKETTKMSEYLESVDYHSRIMVVGDVYPEMIEYIVASIIRYNHEDEKNSIPKEQRTPITLNIFSNGGHLDVALSIMDTIKKSVTPVHTVNIGKAYSAGGLILMAGHKRFSYKMASVLIHQGSTGASGSTSAVMDTLAFYQEQEKMLKNFIIANTNISEEVYDAKYQKEWYMHAEEALKYGVIDEII